VIDFIQHHARALIFSASIPPPNAAAALAALEIMRAEPERVERLRRNGDRWRTGLQQLGFDTGNSVSPIVPVIVGDDMVTFGMWRMLLDEGVYTNPVISPATPNGRQLLRTSCMATHTDEQIDEALEAFKKIGKLADLI
jgi:7-keto-8-aminopelargonate synthetase-like enzyme